MNDTASPAASTSAGFTIIKTRLPYLDRRSLSQAWFSALHLASSGRRASAERPVASQSPRVRPAAYLPNAMPSRPSAAVAPGRLAAASTQRAIATKPDPAAGPARALPRSVARAATHAGCNHPPFRTSLTVGVDKHRVRLLLRREGPTLHVVALCRPDVAEVVRRALAGADAHARGRGENVRSSVRTLDACVVHA